MKKFFAFILSIIVIAGISVPAMADSVTLPVFQTDTLYEAEDVYIYNNNMKLISQEGATNGTLLTGNVDGTLKAEDVAGPTIAFNVYSPEKLVGCDLMISYISLSGSTSFHYRLNGEGKWITVYPSKTTGISWFSITGITLNKGNTLIEIALRVKAVKIDQIKITGCAEEFVEPITSSGTITYPQAMEPNRIDTVPPFEDGDNILFIGDSITHGSQSGQYLGYLSSFYAARFPDKKISYLNKAIGGNDAAESVKRLNYDIFNGIDEPANKAVILLGTNDMELGNYYVGTEQFVGEIWRRNNSLTNYKKNLTDLISGLRENGIGDIILISPPMYDEWGTQSSQLSVGFNNVVRTAAAFQYELSQTMEDVYFVDMSTPMYIIDSYNKRLKGNTFNLVPDRVHPGEVGNWIISYAILKAQGLDDDIANVSIDVASQTVNAGNADVTSLDISEDGVSYTYLPKAIPLGAGDVYRQADELMPLTRELNREIIQVKGLSDGIYDIKFNDAVVMRASADELAEGVNIADKANNPGQQSALKALGFAMARINTDSRYRQFQHDAQSYISSYSLDVSSNEALIASAEDYLASTTNATAIKNLTIFLENKAKEAETLSDSKKLEDVVYSYAVSVASKVEISLSEDQTDTQTLTYKFVDVELPQDTVQIISTDKAPGVSVDRILFEDESGNELTSLPESGKVKVRATLRNNTLSDADAGIWISAYGENKLNSASFADSIFVGAGKEIEISHELSITEAAALLKAGVWDFNKGITPYMASAQYPSGDFGIKAVYVNNRKLNFDPETFSYTYVLSMEDSNAPKVSVIPTNTNADIKITQATSVKDSAVIQAGDKTYSISFKTSVPHLTEIKIDGEPFEDFVADAYYYELPTASMGTISAAAGFGVEVKISQPSTSNPNAVITTEAYNGETRTYTLKFIDRDIGEVTNIKWKGEAAATKGSNRVVPVPSVGIKPVSYADDTKSYDEILNTLRADEAYEDDAYALYSTSYRTTLGMWDKLTNDTYGYTLQFMYADVGSSFLMNENVTRLFKPDVDLNATYISAGADPAKIYEFTLTKPATVYITTPSASTYISGLNAGWTYEFDEAKYALYTPSYNTVIMDDGSNLLLPTGGTRSSDTAKGHVYYQHFEAGENIEIPAHAATASNRKLGIFIVWDEVQN